MNKISTSVVRVLLLSLSIVGGHIPYLVFAEIVNRDPLNLIQLTLA
ncbi:hypothetical protein VCRA2123O444_160009 [Vibrio crassostreae]|nr:hypothetical protein VCRA2119O431_160009 [Vibrio crassostreae]CAK1777017.1 hypothetical protein VCRA2113O409_160010 [Vibrio crassostreae]CAK1784062.1 hypothetical protein VCRA2114O422_160093 [Vibrio crassostreae]CAK1784585.1 hypothetical protein VCRA2118O429_160009 [Vibrio crassostreae]CAK1786937.1 hypothetical protein VCRA2113O411_160010 [Vibrio crassostreae]